MLTRPTLTQLVLVTLSLGALGFAAGRSDPANPADPAAQAAAGAKKAAGADGRFEIDPVHSVVMFKIKHVGVSNFYGRFNDVGGKLLVDGDKPEESLISLTIKVGSVDTNSADRDTHLKSPDFFNAEEFPTIEFESEKVTSKGAGKLEIAGKLKMHGVEKAITVQAEHTGFANVVMMGGVRVGYEAKFTVKRSDFGVGQNMPDILGDDVEVLVSIEGGKK